MTVLHQDAARVLAAWSAPNPRQERVRRDILEYLAADPRSEEVTAIPGVAGSPGGR